MRYFHGQFANFRGAAVGYRELKKVGRSHRVGRPGDAEGGGSGPQVIKQVMRRVPVPDAVTVEYEAGGVCIEEAIGK